MKFPLTKDHFKAWQDAANLAGSLEESINDRIQHIISVWMETFGGKLTNWYFDSADEGQMGNLEDHLYSDAVHSIHVDCNPEPQTNDKYEMVIITKDGGEWAWDSSIPLRWLFEDCDEEIRNGKKLYDEKLKKKKESEAVKKASKKEANEKLVAQAKLKLSKEELAALKKAL